jgi:hypothetical protein
VNILAQSSSQFHGLTVAIKYPWESNGEVVGPDDFGEFGE